MKCDGLISPLFNNEERHSMGVCLCIRIDDTAGNDLVKKAEIFFIHLKLLHCQFMAVLVQLLWQRGMTMMMMLMTKPRTQHDAINDFNDIDCV